jgi:tetratricopeptide (TPR) repeat protein
MSLARRRPPLLRGSRPVVLLVLLTGLGCAGGGMIGQFYFEDGDFERAREAFEKASAARPGDPAVHLWLGKARAELGDLQGASAAWDRSLEVGLRHAEEIESLRRRFWADAQADGQAAMEATPPDIPGALTAFRNALAMHPGEGESLHGLAYTLARADSADAALAAYERLVQQDPSDVAAYRSLAALHVQAGRLEEALGAARNLVAFAPLDPEGLRMVSWLYERAGQVEEAADMAERAASVVPEDVNNLVRLGGLYERIGDSERAGESFERALALAPDHPGALRGRAALLSAQGYDDEALALWELLSAQTPDDAMVWRALARIYAERGDRVAADRARARAAALAPDGS